MVNGQVNLRDAIRRQIDFEAGGKSYKLIENPAVLIVRFVIALSSLMVIFAYLTIFAAPVDGTWMNPALPSITTPSPALYSTLRSTSTTMLMSS
jgi:hypothetical protein